MSVPEPPALRRRGFCRFRGPSAGVRSLYRFPSPEPGVTVVGTAATSAVTVNQDKAATASARACR